MVDTQQQYKCKPPSIYNHGMKWNFECYLGVCGETNPQHYYILMMVERLHRNSLKKKQNK